MDSVIEPIPFAGINRVDVASVGNELESYHGLYTPLLDVENNARKAANTLRG